jgi:hypothetical protein
MLADSGVLADSLIMYVNLILRLSNYRKYAFYLLTS